MLQPRAGGVLPVDKPEGPTSHDVVADARRSLDTRKIGHTGTLDPFASGLLLLCVDAATRLSEYLVRLDKTYAATARLGARTDTLDPEGRIVEESDGWRGLDPDGVAEAVAAIVGPARQVPPQFSAKKVGGEAMYARARRGERVELEPVEIVIHEAEVLAVELPEVRFRLRCSSGTYVRAVARDLGEALGVPAHLTRLRRTRIGRVDVEDALPADALGDPGAVDAAWIDMARAVSHLPAVRVGEEGARRLAHGQAIPWEATETGPPDGAAGPGPVAVLLDGILVAVGEGSGPGLRPRKVFVRG